MSSSTVSSRLNQLLDNISSVVEEVKKNGYEDVERAYNDISGRDDSFPKLSKFSEEWKALCGSLSGRFNMYMVASGVVVGANYGISRVTGVLENPLVRLVSIVPAVFIFYSLLTSFFFSYVIPSVQSPIYGLRMIISASGRGEKGRERFIDIWKKAESLPTSYMQISLLGCVTVHALAFNRTIHPRSFEAADLFVWMAFLLGSMPLIWTFNALQREVSQALRNKDSNNAGCKVPGI